MLLFDVTDDPVRALAPTGTGRVCAVPRYDLGRQVTGMRLVRERTDVPVPAVRHVDPDDTVLGTPFIVMERIDGMPAPDRPPYVFRSWLT